MIPEYNGIKKHTIPFEDVTSGASLPIHIVKTK